MNARSPYPHFLPPASPPPPPLPSLTSAAAALVPPPVLPRTLYVRWALLFAIAAMGGEILAILLRRALDRRGACTLPAPLRDVGMAAARARLAEQGHEAGGYGGAAVAALGVEREGGAGTRPCSFAAARKKEFHPIVVSGDLPAYVHRIEDAMLLLNGIVSIATQYNLQLAYRPLINLRDANDRPFDFLEALLLFGHGEASLLDLYYDTTSPFHKQILPASRPEVDQLMSTLLPRWTSTQPENQIRLLLFSPASETSTPTQDHRNFSSSASWFRQKYFCSPLRALPLVHFSPVRWNVAVHYQPGSGSVSTTSTDTFVDPDATSDAQIAPLMDITRTVVGVMQRQLVGVAWTGLDLHVYLELEGPLHESDSLEQLQGLSSTIQCPACAVTLHTYHPGVSSTALVVLKHLAEADVLIPGRGDLSRVAAVFSTKVKVLLPGWADLGGAINVVEATKPWTGSPTEVLQIDEEAFVAALSGQYNILGD